MAELTFYPDAHEEDTSVDGNAAHIDGAGLTWANMITAVGSDASDTGASGYFILIRCDGDTNEWDWMTRSVFLFDTSSIPDDAVITGVTLSLYGTAKRDDNSITPDINIYSSAPATNTAVVAGDFDSFGTEALATEIAYASWDTEGYNVFTLIDVNSDNFATYNISDTYINKTGVTKLGARNANYDVSETPPAWSSSLTLHYISGYNAEQGTVYRPKLVVTYTLPSIPVADGDLIGIGIIRKG